ncbi:hypothetical protein A9Q84_00205 [Halobacteriovorax marinus]|uniref:WYL domain-containing protein n=1 Tax=Halobacteriovorax marinus TaxID=97084 RepID=A0A1Y5FD32_9BACT|nr:hypothetical protein A9Q84_00205 [Halobacteriovorax marinus]
MNTMQFITFVILGCLFLMVTLRITQTSKKKKIPTREENPELEEQLKELVQQDLNYYKSENREDPTYVHKNSTFNKHYKIIKEAINGNHKVELSYTNANGQSGNRTVRPTEFTKAGKTICFSAFCYYRNENRTFAVKRINGVNIVNNLSLSLIDIFEPKIFETIDKRQKNGSFWIVVDKDIAIKKMIKEIGIKNGLELTFTENGSKSTGKRSAYYVR